MKQITISLREFALPAPRRGSIEAHSGFGRHTAEGQEIHHRVQKKRTATSPCYEAEVPVSCVVDRDDYAFRVDGRMDGIFRDDPPLIEEIKSTFALGDLSRRLVGDSLEHPYCLQLLTYGYIYWRETRIIPRLSFHLVSTRTNDTLDFALNLDIPRYEQWLDRRLDELVQEVRQAEKRAARRRKIAADLPFPFPLPRPGQVELIDTIEREITNGAPLLIQAPTGLGKTMGVLFPVLREALGRGQRVVYVTPKNSQHAVAEDAILRLQQAGSPVKSLSVTARSKICFKDEPLCNPEYCEYARDYYQKVHEGSVLRLLSKKRRLRSRTFRSMGEQYEVCPFELQFDAAEDADILICDYNYVFAPRSPLGRTGIVPVDKTGKPNLIIDEAHNLPSRARECYSSSLSTSTLEKMRPHLASLNPGFRSEASQLIDSSIRVILSCGGRSRPAKIDPPVERFLDQDSRIRGFLARYLQEPGKILPNDPVLQLSNYWTAFTDSLGYCSDPERDEFFTTYNPYPQGGALTITCCDASAMLKECYREYQQVVGFSATLKPFDYYVKLSGLPLEKTRTCEFTSPFPPELRKLIIIPQVSTKYAQRDRNYGKIAEALGRIIPLRRGNYMVFFPSFEFMEKIADIFPPPKGFMLIQQERNMGRADVDGIMDHLRGGETPTIVLAVQGGSLSEGIDYAGDMLVGAFVIGPPLPNFDLERELMKQYFERTYGSGFDYAYTIPAMAKAVQAAGRVIRSENDRGLIILMDSRFIEPEYSRTMPRDWFETDAAELVSGTIIKDVEDFWGR